VLDTPASRIEQLRKDGYLLLTVPPEIEGLLSSVFDAAHRFFLEPEEAKEKNRALRDMGYRPYAGEYSRSPASPDQVESFSVGARMIEPKELHSDSAQVLCERMLACYDVLELIAEELTIELANALSRTAVGEKLRGELHRWSRLQLNYSRPREVQAPFINESHEDGALLTIGHAREPGLELQISDNESVSITNRSNSVLVIPGDIAWLLSGGFLRPMFHRVRPVPSCPERLALLFFADVNPRLCEPWVRNEINQGVDIGGLVLKNPLRFGLGEWELE
jgi:isopenicillin N synthase-like dioxygenase